MRGGCGRAPFTLNRYPGADALKFFLLFETR